MTETVAVEEVRVPAAPGEDGWDDFSEATEVRNAAEAAAFGSRELAYTPQELLPYWQNAEYAPARLFVARKGGRVVGRGVHEHYPNQPARIAWVSIEVHPEHRREGIGTAIADTLDEVSRSGGFGVSQCYALSPLDAGEQIVPRTGTGSLPLRNAEVAFLLARGFALEQVERVSRLPLPGDPTAFEAGLAPLLTRAGAEYRLHSWVGRTPERWLDGIAHLYTRMGTDTPSGGMEYADAWNAERLRSQDDDLEDSPRVLLTTIVEHVPSGLPAGFTVFDVPPETTRTVGQEDTLVVREHRGRRLGMLLKLANLAELERRFPGHPSVVTWNAEENRHMLAVNEDLGFAEIAREGAWRREG